FREEGYELTDKGLDGVLANFKQPHVEDLIAAVGAGIVADRDVLAAVYPGVRERKPPAKKSAKARAEAPADLAVGIRGLIPGMAVHFARCCHPLPGDRIVGIITTGKGVTIHTIDCATLESFSEAPERWIDVGWDSVGEGVASAY